jgi:tetratricopeptide (TPR) repeat protein/NAD-dependent SIR2 family protein deacetylase
MKNIESQTLPLEVENTINAIASGINAGHTIIFCGAGISRGSGFPVVREFVPYVLLTLCAGSEEILSIEASLKDIKDDRQRQDKLKQITAEKMEVSPDVVEKIINGLPFEAFVEALRDNSVMDKVFDIYDADAYKPHVVPNTNHIFLSKLVATGKVRTIVTTNFDQLIEKALEQQGKLAGRDYDLVYREKDFEHIDWEKDRCRLIKIHGSIDDKQAMAITLCQVAKKELSEARKEIIRHVFNQEDHKQVLILGYSCSDVFDLSPQIEKLEKNLNTVYIVQHSGGPDVEDIREQRAKNPFKGFEDSKRLFLCTDRLVEALWEKLVLDKPYALKKNTANWKEKVDEWYATSIQRHSEASKFLIIGGLFLGVAEWRISIRAYEHAVLTATENDFLQVKVSALTYMGSAYMELGEPLRAIELGEELLKMSSDMTAGKSLIDHIAKFKGKGSAFELLGSVYTRCGEHRMAIEMYEKALEISRRFRDVQGEGTTLLNMGSAYMEIGEAFKAIEMYEKAMELYQRIGDVKGEGTALDCIGSVYREIGEALKAIKMYEKAMEIHQHIGDVQSEGISLLNMGSAYMEIGEIPKALEMYEKALEIHQRIGDVQSEGTAFCNIGIAFAQLGLFNNTIPFYEAALGIFRRIGNARGEGTALYHMGITYAEYGDYDDAIDLYEEAIEIHRRIGNARGEGTALYNMGIAYIRSGEVNKARECLENSKVIFVRLGLLHMASTTAKLMKKVGL